MLNHQLVILMKGITFFLMIMLSTTLFSHAQEAEEKAIKEVVTSFIAAGDAQDAEQMDALLDTHYRVVMNRLFGSAEVSVLPRNVYLEKIRTKEFGGDKRELSFEEMILNGRLASVKVRTTGEKMSMVSLLTLVKDGEGNWKLVEDAPVIVQ